MRCAVTSLRDVSYLCVSRHLLQSPYTLSFTNEQKLTLSQLMLYIYGAPILDVSRSHTTTQHSR